MDQIEQGLRAMSEPRNPEGAGGAHGSTELWKRALEISRAEERAGLVHPAADREASPRGRRMLIAKEIRGNAGRSQAGIKRAGPQTPKRPPSATARQPRDRGTEAGGQC